MSPAEIKSELVKRGIKQNQIARDLGVTPGAVWMVIHKRTPSERIYKHIRGLISEAA